jgi:hypothetical protein
VEAPDVRELLQEGLDMGVAQLLRALAQAQQLQNPAALKQALHNSGSLLEARLAQAAAQPRNTVAAELPQALAGDIKAQIARLLAAIGRPGMAVSDDWRGPAPSMPQDPLYDARPQPPRHGAPPPQQERDDTVTTLLHQLGKLLQAGLARIQINQLDSAATRHPGGADSVPVPAWVFELPLRTPRGTDNLHVRIEQRPRPRDALERTQWTVQLAFDLHELGKLAATLTILGRDVAAVLWSEREHTHRAVQAEIDTLRTGLEAAGVKVTEVQCRLGLPPPRSAPLMQQLVDVRT